MGLQDFGDKDESENDSTTDEQTTEKLDADTAIGLIERQIYEHASVSSKETNNPPEGGRVCVRGDTVVANTRSLATVMAVILTNINEEEFKEITELLTNQQLQKNRL